MNMKITEFKTVTSFTFSTKFREINFSSINQVSQNVSNWLRVDISSFTMWKLWQFTLTFFFWQKFRQINAFTKEITKQLIWRNILSVRAVRVNFSFFHTVLWKYEIFVKMNTAQKKEVITRKNMKYFEIKVNISTQKSRDFTWNQF